MGCFPFTVNRFPDTLSLLLFAQQPAGSIKGTITTADKKSADGISVLLKNTINSAVADNDGNFEIKNITPGNYTLVVSLVRHKVV